MDPVSQGLLGAVIPESVAGKKDIRLAALVGFLSGMLADIDVFIRSSTDPLLTIDYHRHFTHSIIFIPIGGLVAASILWLFLKRRMSFGKLYLYATLGYATAGLLDACTNYGTKLLWPFSDTRIAWNIISIIDPIFTLTLGALVILAIIKKSPGIGRIGLVFAVVYLLFGLYQRERAHDVLLSVAQERGHTAENILVHPSIGNNILWRGVYEYDGEFHTDAIRLGFFQEPVVYEGGSVRAFDIKRNLPELEHDTVLYNDISRFGHFTNGYLVLREDYPNVLGDIRYSILPNGTVPLWGIRIDVDKQNEHIEMADYDRSISPEKWHKFFSMLRGHPID